MRGALIPLLSKGGVFPFLAQGVFYNHKWNYIINSRNAEAVYVRVKLEGHTKVLERRRNYPGEGFSLEKTGHSRL